MKIQYSSSDQPYNSTAQTAAYFPKSIKAYKTSSAPKKCTRFSILYESPRTTLLKCADGFSKKLFYVGGFGGHMSLSFMRDYEKVQCMYALYEHGFVCKKDFVAFNRQGLREFYRDYVVFKVNKQLETLRELGVVGDRETLYNNIMARTELPPHVEKAKQLVDAWDKEMGGTDNE